MNLSKSILKLIFSRVAEIFVASKGFVLMPLQDILLNPLKRSRYQGPESPDIFILILLAGDDVNAVF